MPIKEQHKMASHLKQSYQEFEVGKVYADYSVFRHFMTTTFIDKGFHEVKVDFALLHFGCLLKSI